MNDRTIYRKGSIIGIEMVHAAGGSAWRSGRLKRNRMERCSCGRGYLRGRDTLVHDHVIVRREAIRDFRVIECASGLVAR